ncbi:hypothetical protein N5S77_10430 [Aliarcobacter cryaerophilus]|nr:hypothetical protein [Aliarcobacter cryaerophilus]
MSKLKEILRLRHECNLSASQISRALNISHTVVNNYLSKATVCDKNYDELKELSYNEIISNLFPSLEKKYKFNPPNFAYIHKELRRKRVTLELLHEEYATSNPNGYYGYTIVFPRNSNYKNALNKDYIYPRKSKLEEQLDICFQAARMHFAMPQIYEFADSLQIPVYQATFDSYKKEAVNEKELCSFSWNQSVLDNWGNPIVENYKDTFTYETIVVDVVLNKDEFNIDEKIYEKVLLTLNNDLEIRNKLISWKFKLDGKDIYYLNNSTNIMNQLWDGIRNLRYTNHEVALIIKKSMHYFKHDYHNVDIKNIFDDQITIVVSDKIGSFNKAYVSRKKLSNTIRKDLNNVLIDKVDDLDRNLEKVIIFIFIFFNLIYISKLIILALFPKLLSWG